MFGRGSRLRTWEAERVFADSSAWQSPPPLAAEVPQRAVWPPVAALTWHAIFFGNRLGHRSTPLSAGR